MAHSRCSRTPHQIPHAIPRGPACLRFDNVNNDLRLSSLDGHEKGDFDLYVTCANPQLGAPVARGAPGRVMLSRAGPARRSPPDSPGSAPVAPTARPARRDARTRRRVPGRPTTPPIMDAAMTKAPARRADGATRQPGGEDRGHEQPHSGVGTRRKRWERGRHQADRHTDTADQDDLRLGDPHVSGATRNRPAVKKSQ
jgi:hypothetical protein